VKQYIEQSCPNCHRSLRVRTEYVGKRIVCRHCQMTFTPAVPLAEPAPPPADERLARLEEELRQTRDERDQLTQARAADAVTMAELQARIGDLQRTHDERVTAHEEAVRVHEASRGQWEADRHGLLAEWDQKHQSHAEEAGRLHEQLAGVRRQLDEERTTLQDEAIGWREQYQAVVGHIDVLTRDVERLSGEHQETEQTLRTELGRLSQAVEESRQQGATAAGGREELAARVQELQAEAERLGGVAEEARQQAEAAAREREEFAEQASDLRAEAEHLEQELQQARTELALQAAEPKEDVAGLHQQLQAAQREAERLRAVVAEVEERAGQVAEVDAELRAAQAENGRLRQELAAAQQAKGTDTGDAGRQELAEQVRVLHAELEKQRQATATALQHALETACTDASWRLSGGYAPVEDASTAAAQQQQQQRMQQQVEAMQQDFAREKAALQNELQRLWQENNQLRQWLGSCGVQFMQVPAPPKSR
jgi:hypothetical protein